MKSKQIIIGSGVILSSVLSMLSPPAQAGARSCAGVHAEKGTGKKSVTNLEQFTSAVARYYQDSSQLTVDLTHTSMAPFLKSFDSYEAGQTYLPAVTEFLSPTLMAFSVTYAVNSGKSATVAPLKLTAQIPGIVLTWGEAQAAADALANKKGLPSLRAQQQQLADQMEAMLEKKDIEGYYKLSDQSHELGKKAVQILQESHNQAYGEMANSPELRSNRDADKIGMVHSPRTEVREQKDYFHTAYNRLIELKLKSPELFDQVVQEMTVNPSKYLATLILKYQGKDVSIIYEKFRNAFNVISKQFEVSKEESEILEAFADLTAATVIQRDRFGAMITPRNNGATYALGARLVRALAAQSGGMSAKELQDLGLQTISVLDLGVRVHEVGRNY